MPLTTTDAQCPHSDILDFAASFSRQSVVIEATERILQSPQAREAPALQKMERRPYMKEWSGTLASQ